MTISIRSVGIQRKVDKLNVIGQIEAELTFLIDGGI
jgi:hypothetical protein